MTTPAPTPTPVTPTGAGPSQAKQETAPTQAKLATSVTTKQELASSLRRRLKILMEDTKEIRDQGRAATTDPAEILMFKGMYETLPSLIEGFDAPFNRLLELIDNKGNSLITNEDLQLRKTMRRYYYECHTFNLSFERGNNNQTIDNTSAGMNSTCGGNATRARAKLPTISLPKFSGDRRTWPRFRDLFQSLVIGDPELTDADRYHYLVASLEDPATALVSNLPLTAANFQVAWESLKDVYDNQRLLAAAYLDQILNLRPLERRPTPEQLANRVAELSEAVAAFELLSIPNSIEFVFFHLACRTIDTNTRVAFENNNESDFPTFKSLVEFLRRRSNAAELASSASHSSKLVKPLSITKTPNARTALFSAKQVDVRPQPLNPCESRPKVMCIACKSSEAHPLQVCDRFCSASPEQRLNMLQGWRGCRNCLAYSHKTPLCDSKHCCRICHARHHTKLHLGSSRSSPKSNIDATTQQSRAVASCSGVKQTTRQVKRVDATTSTSTTPALSHSISSQAVEVMLGTALCNIGGPYCSPKPMRLVLDSGSHFSFITRDCAERIGLAIEPHSAEIWGIGETPLCGFKGRSTCTLSPLNSNSPKFSATVIVVDRITSPLPGFETQQGVWEPYLGYNLADPEFWVTRPIDFLLGCDLFSDVVSGQVLTVQPNLPKLLGTIFGFAVVGRVRDVQEATQACSLHTKCTPNLEPLQQQLQRFWALEEPPNNPKMDPLEEACESHFKATHSRLSSGRYCVRLPFLVPEPQFFGTKGVAMKRLHHLENKLARNPELKKKYLEFMREYLDLHHMEIAKQPGQVLIPHHAVTKGVGPSLKVRVVFDASAQSASVSLNETLMVGPKLQKDIGTILLNFRIHAYVFTTDIVKMFRQIIVHEEDRTFQHILFRFDPSEAVTEYQLNTVTYGTTCAPYLANRVLHQLREDEGASFPLASLALSEDNYVDDFATGAPTITQAIDLQSQLINLMSKGGFSLDKWAANHPTLVAAVSQSQPELAAQSPVSLELDIDSATVKILGMQWEPKPDFFTYQISPPDPICTKRSVLSSVARIYDPLGYLCPSVLYAKEIVQMAWKLQLGWDEAFPPELSDRWKEFVQTLEALSQVQIPRWLLSHEVSKLHLLIFADASERAYCAAAYLHVNSSPNQQFCNLILAKTKLAPIKVISIPRLELCAALLAARLRESLSSFCNRVGYPVQTHYFTDSMVVLGWLATPTYRLKTFVANRVETILELTKDGTWHHVKSGENPSDLGSRGVAPVALAGNTLWFQGPSWASAPLESWPLGTTLPAPDLPDLKPPGIVMVAAPSIPYLIEWTTRFSSFTRLTGSFAYLLRFIHWTRNQAKRTGLLNLTEIRQSTSKIIKLFQAHYFFNEAHLPDNPDTLTKLEMPKNLLCLNPFFDSSGLLRVGGRIRHSEVSWSIKHPILLPAKTHLTYLIIKHYHSALLHPGPTLLLAYLRTKYWVVGAKNAVRALSRSCVQCRKLGASPLQPLMGDLPKCRFREGRAFLHVGIDFAGPFQVKESTRRKISSSKVYLCLFVCLSTKAVHLEMVSALSTEAFFATLERFIGRRGLPEKIYSDNGTNFVGAANCLKELYMWYRKEDTQGALKCFAVSHEIEWTFICPSAPFEGGLWEAGVKAVKRLLRTVYGEAIMTYEELFTWFIRVEAILNSRPLCPLSSDPNDLCFLSPGHFLVGAPLLAVPEPSLISLPENRLSRWEMVYQKSQHFWNRWRLEYLTCLQERNKWKRNCRNLKIGDLVIVVYENAPRLSWPTGRIVEVHPGADGVIRVATVRTARSVLKRPTNKLIPLFLPNPSQAST